MEKFNAFMSKKIGGVPVVAIVALFAGVVLFYAIRMKPAPAETADETETFGDAVPDGGDTPDTSQPVFKATPTILQPSGTGGSVTAIPQEDTNDLWSKRVIASLQTSGFSYALSVGMVQKFLAGESLSVEEGKARDKAISVFGMPPEGVQYAPDIPAPEAVTPPPAVQTPTPEPPVEPVIPATIPAPSKPARRQGVPRLTHVVEGNSDNSAGELAQLYYGYNTPDARQRIWVVNGDKENYKIGDEVIVPKDKNPVYYKSTAHTNTIIEIAKKNGTTTNAIAIMNPKLKFPVKPGTRVQVA